MGGMVPDQDGVLGWVKGGRERQTGLDGFGMETQGGWGW